jgi:hypothetical protein
MTVMEYTTRSAGRLLGSLGTFIIVMSRVVGRWLGGLCSDASVGDGERDLVWRGEGVDHRVSARWLCEMDV